MSDEPKYVTKSRLVGERGWSDKSMADLLGEPDRIVPNPHYRSAAPMRLYLLERVEAAERSRHFRPKHTSAARKRGAARAVKTKTGKVVRWAQTVQVTCEFPKYCMLAGIGSTRQQVNFLRHECTSYDDKLLSLYGKTGKDAAYAIIKNRILEMIAAEYPDTELEREARRQMLQAPRSPPGVHEPAVSAVVAAAAECL